MIDIVIDNTKWACPTTWNEISIRQTIELEAVTNNLSERVKEYLTQTTASKSSKLHQKRLSSADKEELAQFYCYTLTNLCGTPPTICDAIEPEQLSKFVETHIYHLIAGTLSNPLFTPEGILEFECKGEWFALPRTEVDQSGESRPCAEISAEEFCLATDLYIANRVGNSAAIIATMCRPEGEAYCRETALKRTEAIKSLPMSIAWELFALLTQAHSYMSKAFPTYYKKGAEQTQDRADRLNPTTTNSPLVSWQQIPIVVAKGVPSEVMLAQKMNCYQLMQIVALGNYDKN